MLANKIAARYAEALSQIACERNRFELWDKELADLSEAFDSMPDLRTFLAHPEIPRSRKEAMVREVFEGRISDEILALLLILIKHGRDMDLAPIRHVYKENSFQRLQLLPVTVRTPIPLTEAETRRLVGILERQTGLIIKLEQLVDPELIAGMTVTAGDRRVDASARTTLEELRKAVAQV
jgi:F-type H+-transporting ATPase subunit delta